ncbi:unnamed protein product [Nesidiocoris tenuis]|uniref:Uncharacterized protein n=1 Tax=Nesidiocoris tenuis TaxID=355587 RepID=A0A6H5GA40_9HEMI|nr:unnamed protein product [Nesidiocoris tenuis]
MRLLLWNRAIPHRLPNAVAVTEPSTKFEIIHFVQCLNKARVRSRTTEASRTISPNGVLVEFGEIRCFLVRAGDQSEQMHASHARIERHRGEMSVKTIDSQTIDFRRYHTCFAT